jgi:alpha-beta hydrolase superfamily lysophospholipase
MSKIIIIIGVSLVAIYVIAFVIGVLIQKKIVYPVPWDRNQDCSKKISDEVIERGDTTLYYQNNNSDAVVVFYHGNADIVCDKVDLVDIFNEKGISYIFVEYPGYSGNSGIVSDTSLKESTKEVIAFIDEKNYKHVYVIGQSIGSGLAAFHTSQQAPERLLLFSPFTTLTDVVVNMFPMYPRFLIRRVFDQDFDNVASLKDYMGKLLVVHGTKDTVVPSKQGEKLFDLIPTKDKRYVEAQGYRHANIYGAEEFQDAIKQIIE